MPDAIINALVNAGGMGLLAAALLWLHRDAISSFRQELKAERNLFRQALRAIGVSVPRDHEEEER